MRPEVAQNFGIRVVSWTSGGIGTEDTEDGIKFGGEVGMPISFGAVVSHLNHA